MEDIIKIYKYKLEELCIAIRDAPTFKSQRLLKKCAEKLQERILKEENRVGFVCEPIKMC